ncbi:hypothetical protein QUB25_18185 [Microcoleus sp. B3-D7]
MKIKIELKPSQPQIEQTAGAIAQRLQGSIGLISLFLAMLALSFCNTIKYDIEEFINCNPHLNSSNANTSFHEDGYDKQL